MGKMPSSPGNGKSLLLLLALPWALGPHPLPEDLGGGGSLQILKGVTPRKSSAQSANSWKEGSQQGFGPSAEPALGRAGVALPLLPPIPQ